MNKLKRMNGRERTFLLITIPILALFFCFNTLPLIKGVIYSFTNFRGYGEFDWVGLRNYADLFTDARVGKSYLFTFKLEKRRSVKPSIRCCRGRSRSLTSLNSAARCVTRIALIRCAYIPISLPIWAAPRRS